MKLEIEKHTLNNWSRSKTDQSAVVFTTRKRNKIRNDTKSDEGHKELIPEALAAVYMSAGPEVGKSSCSSQMSVGATWPSLPLSSIMIVFPLSTMGAEANWSPSPKLSSSTCISSLTLSSGLEDS